MSNWLPGTFGPKGDPVVNLFTNPSFEASGGVVEVRRNGCINPRPIAGQVSGWQSSGGSFSYADGFTVTTGTSTTPYIFSAGRAGGAQIGKIYAIRCKVKATQAGGGTLPAFIMIRPHKRTGNLYYTPDGGLVTVPVDGAQHDVAFYWTATVNIADGETFDVTAVGNGAAPTGFSLSMTDVLIEEVPAKSAQVPAFFSADTVPSDPDLSAAWVGAPYASPTTLTGMTASGIADLGNLTAIRSELWSSLGNYSARLIPTASTTHSFAVLRTFTSADVGKTFTAKVRVRLAAPTLTVAVFARSLFVTGDGNQQGPQVPNLAGEHELEWSFTVAAAGSLRLYHGGSYGETDIWIDECIVVEGEYSGDYFDGDSEDTDERTHAWTGQRHDSPSTRQEMEPIMATIYGTLSDFGLQSLAAFEPQLKFTPSGAGVNGVRLFAARPILCPVSADGSFAVLLEPTGGVVPEVWYEVSIEYLNAGGQFTSYDVLGYRLRVPAPGGAIGDLPDVPLSPETVLVSLSPPPPGFKGWYLNAPGPGRDPGDPDDPASSGTGILEIVS